jgi:hypothetical protein
MCKCVKDHERKRLQNGRYALRIENATQSQNVQVASISTDNKRWKKCVNFANNLNKVLHYVVADNYNDEDKRQIVRRFLDKESVQAFLPKFAKHGRDIERKLKLYKSMKYA